MHMNRRHSKEIRTAFVRRHRNLWGHSVNKLIRPLMIVLFLVVVLAPFLSSAISPAPFQKAASKCYRSPAVRSGLKQLARHPAGAAVAVIIAIGMWAGTALSQKRKPTGEVGTDSNQTVGAIGPVGVPGTGSDVGVGVVAPETAVPGETVMVQVTVVLSEGLADAIEKARALDAVNGAVERGTLLLRDVPDGAQLAFRLDVPELRLEDAERMQCHDWNGGPFLLQFFVTVPDDTRIGTRPARLLASVNGRPVGRIGFVLNIVTAKHGSTKLAKTVPHGYSQYFVSYSDKDLERVLPRVQGLRIAELDRDVHFFFDKVSLAPGERYETEIFDFIDNRADAFLLFWSTNSAESEWVEKEWRRALVRQKEKDGLPDIIPVPLDRDAPPPPKELSDLHFSDSLLLLSTWEQTTSSSRMPSRAMKSET